MNRCLAIPGKLHDGPLRQGAAIKNFFAGSACLCSWMLRSEPPHRQRSESQTYTAGEQPPAYDLERSGVHDDLTVSCSKEDSLPCLESRQLWRKVNYAPSRDGCRARQLGISCCTVIAYGGDSQRLTPKNDGLARVFCTRCKWQSIV